MQHAAARSTRPAIAALAAALVLLAALQALPAPWHQMLRYERQAVLQGELWRLWTGHLIHLGWAHWALNAVGLVLCALLADAPPAPRTLTRRWCALSLGVSVGLVGLAPAVAHYVGLSGVLYGLFVLALWPGARRRDPVSLAALGAIAAWLLWQLGAGPARSEIELIGGDIIVQAHVLGVLCAALMLAGAAAWRAARARTVPRHAGAPPAGAARRRPTRAHAGRASARGVHACAPGRHRASAAPASAGRTARSPPR